MKPAHDTPAERVVHIAAPLLHLPLHLRFARTFDDDAFYDFCANHRDLRIERSRSEGPTERPERPERLHGDPELPGLVVDLTRIYG